MDDLSELERLQLENERLRVELLACEKLIGKHAENYVIDLIGGTRTPRSSPFDVLTDGGLKIEVKYSKIGSQNRWWWTRVTGSMGRKEFDRLILIGEPNDEHRCNYLDPKARYVLFDIPFANLADVITQNPDEPTAYIQLNSKPHGVRKDAGIRLYDLYQVTADQLVQRYRTSAVISR